jgi:hypothetical protein
MFFEFLNKIFDGDQDLIGYLQKFFGYTTVAFSGKRRGSSIHRKPSLGRPTNISKAKTQ